MTFNTLLCLNQIMTTANWLTLMGIIASLIGGGAVGYFVKYYLDKKQEFSTRNAEVMRTAYSELIALILELMSQSELGTMSSKTMLKRMNSFYEKYILYASPEVINSFGDLMQFFYNSDGKTDPKESMIKITRVFKFMRNDLHLSNDDLGQDAERLLRARLNDYGKYFNS